MHVVNTSGRHSSRPTGLVRTALGLVVALLVGVLAAGCGASGSAAGPHLAPMAKQVSRLGTE